MSSETSASFMGVFSLRTPEQVQEMVQAVRNVVEKSAKIFFVVSNEDNASGSLMNDINTITRLSADFPGLCKDETVKLRSQEIVKSMNNSRSSLQTTLGSHRNYVPFTEEETQQISEEVANVLEQTAYLSEQMEIEQNKRVLSTVKTGFECLKLLKETDSGMHLDAKLQNVQQIFDTLIRAIANRADVTEEGDIKSRLKTATSALRTDCPELIRLTREYIMGGKNEAVGSQQIESIKRLALVIKDLTDLLQDPASRLAASCNFEYRKIAEGLDALTDAVKANSATAATEKAKAIVDEINKLHANAGSAGEEDSEAKKALLSSSERLKNMTAKLLNATKASLANPADSDASKDFEKAVNELKVEAVSVAQLKAPKKGSNSTKETLLSASKKLAAGVKELDNSLNT